MQTHHTYPPESAGRLMTEKVPRVLETQTVRDVEQYLIKNAKELDTIDYLYVMDANELLVGVLSIKELFDADRSSPIVGIMSRTLITARAHTDQERVAFLALKHNIKAIPVIDSSRHLLGVVPADDILRVLDHEASENLARLGGLIHGDGFENVMSMSIKKSVMHRLPWLVLGLIGGLLTAGIIGWFEEILAIHIILVTFIPLIVYLAGVIGTQVTTMIVRDLAVDPKISFMPYLIRQTWVVVLLGLVLGTILFFVTWLFYGEAMVGLILAVALFFAALSSLITSLIFPYVLNLFNIDPADAGGPISIILQDMISVAIYLSVALLLLGV